MGGFVLEHFLIKKKVGPKTPIFSIDFRKMRQDFLKKQNHRGSAAQIFFTLDEKPLQKFTNAYAYLPPFYDKKQAIFGKVVKANHV